MGGFIAPMLAAGVVFTSCDQRMLMLCVVISHTRHQMFWLEMCTDLCTVPFSGTSVYVSDEESPYTDVLLSLEVFRKSSLARAEER